MRSSWTPWALLSLATLWAPGVHAGELMPNPYAPTRAPAVLDLSRPSVPADPRALRFEDLDEHREHRELPETALSPRQLPDGWVQEGSVVVPRVIADGGSFAPDSLRPGLNPSRDQVEGPDDADLCAFPDDPLAPVYEGLYDRGTEYPRHGTIYMNYTGGMLKGGGENAAEDQSTLAWTGHPFPAYTGGEERAIAVAQAVQADFAEMAVRVVYLDRPPKRLPYVMVMMGGSYQDTTVGPSGGVAPGADCLDKGLRNVCYAFVNKDSVTTQSNIASQELGHTMGLGHTYGSDRVMAFGYDTNASIDMGFGAECTPVFVASGQGSYCKAVNRCHCGGDGIGQHDLRTLKAIYAPPGPDVVPPTITITSPADGASFPEGAPITVQVEPWDNFGGYGWDLSVAQGDKVLGEVVDYELSQQFVLSLPPGTYTLTTRVQDHADQIGEDVITITVEGAAADTDTDTDTIDTDTPTSSDSDSSGAASDGSSGAAEAGGQDSDGTAEDGCSCREGERLPPLVLLTPLLLLGLRRRRA